MNNWSRKISRRAVLRGIGAAVSLPLLDVIAPASVSAAAKPVNRLAYLFSPTVLPAAPGSRPKSAMMGDCLSSMIG